MLKVVKIGGNIIDDPQKLEGFINNLAVLPGPKILIHGGGKVATDISRSLGIDATMIDGRRVTDSQTIDVVTMVYCGLINKNITASLNAAGCSATGLCGADNDLIISRRRPPIPIDYGYVGDPETVNGKFLKLLLDNSITPVIAPVTTDGEGTLLNTNADTVARAVAVRMSEECETELIYCFEKDGVLSDPADDRSVIADIDRQEYEELKRTGIISGGMLPKLDNAFTAISDGVSRVVICHASHLLSEGDAGTIIRR